MRWECSDGGRAAAGYKGETGDCTVRAIAIAGQMDYKAAYDLLHQAFKNRHNRTRTQRKKWDSFRGGLDIKITREVLGDLGWTWTPTMGIGTGCTVHMRSDELPSGRLVVRVSKHLAAVIDGVLHDTHDCTRKGTRCVYGYWTPPEP